MDSEQQWARLTAHKRPRKFAFAIGELLGGVMPRQAGAEVLRQLRGALDGVVDDAFREHYSGLGFAGGRLTLVVDDAAAAYLFRRQYLFQIKEHLARACPQIGITDIRFEVAKRDSHP